jgi:hypothetical protein
MLETTLLKIQISPYGEDVKLWNAVMGEFVGSNI